MNSTTSRLSAFVILMLTSTLIGCGSAYQGASTDAGASSNSGQSDATGSAGVEAAMAKATSASLKAQTAMNDARVAIAGISDPSGNIAMNLFGSLWSSVTGGASSAPIQIDTSGSGLNVVSSGLLSPLVDRLQTVFNVVFAKVDEVTGNINSARRELAVAAARLDADDPLQALLLTQITKQMNALDVMERTFKAQMITLAGKVDLAKAQLSKLVTFGTSFIPVPGLNILAGMLVDTFLLSDVNNLLDAVKLKLLLV